MADVDHLFPRILQQLGFATNLDQVWNLVLACRACNRGASGKFDRPPAIRYVERLERRNEYLIVSHHPLRETLINETGLTSNDRRDFLRAYHGMVTTLHVATPWQTAAVANPAF